MKILLVNPPSESEKTLGKYKNILPALPPLGLGYISAILLDAGCDVSVIDAFAEKLDLNQTLEKIVFLRPHIVGITCMTPSAPLVHKLARKLKVHEPHIKIVLGGIHPSLMPEETLKDRSIDYVIRGEGEYSFLELAEALANGGFLEGIKGLSFRQDNQIIHNGDREFNQCLDDLPFPAWKLFPTEYYSAPPQWLFANPVFPFLTSRGCPNRCKFCSLVTMGRMCRTRSTENIMAEIEHLVDVFGTKQLMLMDATFPLNKKKAMEFCDTLIRKGLHKKIVWTCEARVNTVDKDIFKKMKESGCKLVAFGIESGVQELLDRMNKGFSLEQVKRAVRDCQEAGLEVYALYMLGFPGETREMSLQTIKFAKELDTDYAKFNLTVPYPGTELFDEAWKDGKLKSLNWEDYTSLASMTNSEPVYCPEDIEWQELISLQKRAIREYYFRPKMVFRHLIKMTTPTQFKAKLSAVVTVTSGLLSKNHKEIPSRRDYWEGERKRRPPQNKVIEAFAQPKIEYIKGEIGDLANMSLLDVGCGNGFFSYYFGNQCKTIGMDYSAFMLSINPCNNMIRGNALELPFKENTFDVVFCSNLLHHLDTPCLAIREMERVSKKFVILSEPNRDNPLMFAFNLLAKQERRAFHFSLSYLKNLVRNLDMEIISVQSLGSVLPNRTPKFLLPIFRLLDSTRGLRFYNMVIGRKSGETSITQRPTNLAFSRGGTPCPPMI